MTLTATPKFSDCSDFLSEEGAPGLTQCSSEATTSSLAILDGKDISLEIGGKKTTWAQMDGQAFITGLLKNTEGWVMGKESLNQSVIWK